MQLINLILFYHTGKLSAASTNLTAAVDERHTNELAVGDDGPSTNGIILIIASLLFIAMHAIGPNPVPFIAPSDIFDHESKGAATSLSISITWIGLLITALTFPQCQLYLKEYMVVPFIVVIVFQVVPFYFYFPETKGQPTSVISNRFQIKYPWRTPIGLQKINQNWRNNSNFIKGIVNNGSPDTISVETGCTYNKSE